MITGTCAVCGAAYPQTVVTRIYCSQRCCRRAHYLRETEGRQQPARVSRASLGTPITAAEIVAAYLESSHEKTGTLPRFVLLRAFDRDAQAAARAHDPQYWYPALSAELYDALCSELGRAASQAERAAWRKTA